MLSWLNKYEYLTGEKIFPSHQSQILKQAKFIYAFLRKTVKKQIKKYKSEEKNKLTLRKSQKLVNNGNQNQLQTLNKRIKSNQNNNKAN